MFADRQDRSEASVLLSVAQVACAPFGCLIVGLLVGALLEQVLHVVTRDRFADLLLGYLVFTGAGLALGYTVQNVLRTARRSAGLLVWIAPCCVLAWGVLDQARAPGTVLGTYFVFTRGDEGIGVALITWPALSACFYSVGVLFASLPATTGLGATFRKRVWHRTRRQNPE